MTRRLIEHGLAGLACLLGGAILALFVLDGLDRQALHQQVRFISSSHQGVQR